MFRLHSAAYVYPSLHGSVAGWRRETPKHSSSSNSSMAVAEEDSSQIMRNQSDERLIATSGSNHSLSFISNNKKKTSATLLPGIPSPLDTSRKSSLRYQSEEVFVTDESSQPVLYGTGATPTASFSESRNPSRRTSLNPKADNAILQVSSDYMHVVGIQPTSKLLRIDQPVAKAEQRTTKDLEAHKDTDPRKNLLRNPSNKLSKEALLGSATKRLRKRRILFEHRIKLTNLTLALAIFGLALAVIDSELCANVVISEISIVATILRFGILVSTIALVILIILYHVCETKLAMADSGTSWQVNVTLERALQCAFEASICAICPVPFTGHIIWTVISEDPSLPPQYVSVPLRLVLTFPMFLRLYLVGRFMVIHSKQFKDAGTRSIAAMNRISVDFRFVFKTMMREHPLIVLLSFTVCMWIINSWLTAQCERFASEGPIKNRGYLDALWLTVITSMTVGYGDVTPNTYCGRAIAIMTGAMGFGISTALIAVVTKKFELSRAEQHVNAFVADTKVAVQALHLINETVQTLSANQKRLAAQLEILMHAVQELAAAPPKALHQSTVKHTSV